MNDLAVYVHVPFCTVKCGYCDFNAYAGMTSLHSDYREALLRDIASWSERLAGSRITSIGFGGGTPGEVPPGDIAAVIRAIGVRAPLADDAEVTLEANPGTTTGADLAALRAAGVTRISFGVQSFTSRELRFLDRIHSPEAAAACVPLARGAGFSHVNLDLIYGLPEQTAPGWEATLERALALEPDHLSCYCLTVEEGTPLAARVAAGEVQPPDGDLAAEMHDLAATVLGEAGFEQYELSNWARPGHRSRHNLTYWNDGDYLGIGAGAHGYLAGERYENVAHPRAYIAATREAKGSAGAWAPHVARAYRPTREQAICDWLSLRLRLVEGVPEGAFERKFGVALESAVGPVIERCREAGVLERAEPLRLTPRGRQLHGEVAALVLAYLEGAG